MAKTLDHLHPDDPAYIGSLVTDFARLVLRPIVSVPADVSHSGLLIEGVYVPGQGCVITNIHNTVLTANLIYSMVLDFIVLALTSWKTIKLRNKSRKSLGGLIIQDGLIFFASS